jgi:hypothetical protein
MPAVASLPAEQLTASELGGLARAPRTSKLTKPVGTARLTHCLLPKLLRAVQPIGLFDHAGVEIAKSPSRVSRARWALASFTSGMRCASHPT